MVKLLLRSLLLSLALTSCAPREALPQGSADTWRADLRFLAAELPQVHANAFHTISEERFGAAVRELDAAIPRLNDDQVVVGLMRLVALVGDGHTHLDLPPSELRYPFELSWFGKELRIVAAAASHNVTLGAQVTGVGGITLDSAMVLVSQLVPRGENEGRTRLTATTMLMAPRVLRGLGLSPTPQQATIDVVTSMGNPASVTMNAVSLREVTSWQLAVARPPVWLRRLVEPWWTEALPDSRTIYLSFTGYPPPAAFRQRVSDLGHLLDSTGAQRLVIDLRRNGGGDFTLFREVLLPALKGREAINRAGGIYVITGPATFSAAMVNALDLKRELSATLVGEPTGARPNSYSEHGDFTLPNSGLRVSYSTRHYRFGADSATAVFPDRHIEPTWLDFRSGRDPVLDWIVAQLMR